MRRAAGIALTALTTLLPGAGAAKAVAAVCASWGSQLDGRQVVISTPEGSIGHGRVRTVIRLDAPEAGARRFWGRAPEGACLDGPTERLHVDMSGWTDLFRAAPFGSGCVDGRTPTTLADHRSCAVSEA